MPTIAIVTADAKSRVVIRGARAGARFRLAQDDAGFHLEPVLESAGPRRRNPSRRDLPAPKLDLTEHLDQLRDAGLEVKPLTHAAPPPCRF